MFKPVIISDKKSGIVPAFICSVSHNRRHVQIKDFQKKSKKGLTKASTCGIIRPSKEIQRNYIAQDRPEARRRRETLGQPKKASGEGCGREDG